MPMNDSDLERLLKSAELPARSDEYWEQFPKRVGMIDSAGESATDSDDSNTVLRHFMCAPCE